MQERIKKHDRDIRPADTQISTTSEHAHKTVNYPIWNAVRFIDQNPLGTHVGSRKLST